jgi:hypothetical protein
LAYDCNEWGKIGSDPRWFDMAAGANGDIDAIEAHVSSGAGELGAGEEMQMFRKNSDFEMARGGGAYRQDAEAGEQRGAAGERCGHGIGDKGYRIVLIISGRADSDSTSSSGLPDNVAG